MTSSLEEQQKHRDAYTKPPCDEKVETGVLQLQVKDHNRHTITARRGKKGPPCQLQRKKSLAHALASDFEPSAL